MIQKDDIVSIGKIQGKWDNPWFGKTGIVVDVCQEDPRAYFVDINKTQIMVFDNEVMKVTKSYSEDA